MLLLLRLARMLDPPDAIKDLLLTEFLPAMNDTEDVLYPCDMLWTDALT